MSLTDEQKHVNELKREGSRISSFLHHIEPFVMRNINRFELPFILSDEFNSAVLTEVERLEERDRQIRQELKDLGWKGVGKGLHEWFKKR